MATDMYGHTVDPGYVLPETTTTVSCSPALETRIKVEVSILYGGESGVVRSRLERAWPHDAASRDELMEVCRDAIRAAGYEWPDDDDAPAKH